MSDLPARMIDVGRPAVPLVGRIAERAILLELLANARSGQPGGVVLSGDAGVGKSRLLREVVDIAKAEGMRTLVGHCIDFADSGLPYLPFTEIVGQLHSDGSDDDALSRLLPGSRAMSAQRPDDRLDRGSLFEEVLRALTSVAAALPVLVVIEDAHWADQASRDLLGFLLSRLTNARIAIVVSYRTDDLHRRHPLRKVAAEWSRLPSVRRVDLAPMAPAEIRELMLARRVVASDAAITQIVARAEGNAFFAEELLAAAEQSGNVGSVPAELAELVLVRLDRLSNEAHDVVRMSAVAGRRVAHTLLATVVGLPDGELDQALREAVDAHILEPVGSTGYQFRHALLSEAAYDDLLPGERMRLHATYAAALKKDASLGPAAELARHARESNDLPTAYLASIQAGTDAMALAAPQEAMRSYEAALQLHAAVGEPERYIALVEATVEATSAAGHRFRAVSLARAALAELPDSSTPVDRARAFAALARAELTIDADRAALAATTEALALLPVDPPSLLWASTAALHAHSFAAASRWDESQRWADEALRVTSDLGLDPYVTDAPVTLALLARVDGDPQKASELFTDAIEASRRAGDVAAEMRGRHNLAGVAFENGRLTEAAELYRTAWNRAREQGREWAEYGFDARVLLALSLYEVGRWDDSAQVSFFADEMPPMSAAGLLTAVGALVRVGRGDLNVGPELERLRHHWSQDGMSAVISAGTLIDLYAHSGHAQQAIDAYDELVGAIAPLWGSYWFSGRIRLAAMTLAAITSEVGARPQARVELLVERGGELIADARRSSERSALRRRLGVEAIAWQARAEAEWARLRWRAGVDEPAAEEHVELWRLAVDAFDYEQAYEMARSRARLAAVLRAAGQPGPGREQAELAASFARGVAAAPLLAELGAQAAASRPKDGSQALTDREREVFALLVEARTNRQIAKSLYISEKTVSVHVSNILAKLGVRSRAEAAATVRPISRDG
jgi:DNA-binding CsgD family transcriptional regulator/tetratricopeptide (TPR) repeat protein